VIDAEKANYPIAFMCRLLRVPRSSFYAWANRVETPTRARRRALADEVTAEFAASRQTSGCRRITAALNRRGIECSVGLVADLMRELGLSAVQPRAYKRTTVAGKEPVVHAGPGRAGFHRARAGTAAGRGHHLPAHR
jgi:putative transposase